MCEARVFNTSEFFRPADGEPIRSAVTESKYAAVVVWYVQPGQEIRAHRHPGGQDTWTILAGAGDYFVDEAGTAKPIK